LRIEILYIEGCQNWVPTLNLVRQTVSDLGVDAEVMSIEVKSEEEAKERRFLGSPTVQVDGVDVDPSVRSRTDFSFG
jgi:hypothetical protein